MEFDKAHFWELILNGISITEFVVYLFLMFLGAFMNFAPDVISSVRKDSATPRKFNGWFMIRDNIVRFFMVLAAIYINIVFFEQMTGSPISAYNALVLGFAFEVIVSRGTKKAKMYGPLKKSREQLISKYNK